MLCCPIVSRYQLGFLNYFPVLPYTFLLIIHSSLLVYILDPFIFLGRPRFMQKCVIILNRWSRNQTENWLLCDITFDFFFVWRIGDVIGIGKYETVHQAMTRLRSDGTGYYSTEVNVRAEFGWARQVVAIYCCCVLFFSFQWGGVSKFASGSAGFFFFTWANLQQNPNCVVSGTQFRGWRLRNFGELCLNRRPCWISLFVWVFPPSVIF
jgi:hypothetical protein